MKFAVATALLAAVFSAAAFAAPAVPAPAKTAKLPAKAPHALSLANPTSRSRRDHQNSPPWPA